MLVCMFLILQFCGELRFEILNNKIFKLKPTSLEFDIFPQMVEDGELHCVEIDGKPLDN